MTADSLHLKWSRVRKGKQTRNASPFGAEPINLLLGPKISNYYIMLTICSSSTLLPKLTKRRPGFLTDVSDWSSDLDWFELLTSILGPKI